MGKYLSFRSVHLSVTVVALLFGVLHSIFKNSSVWNAHMPNASYRYKTEYVTYINSKCPLTILALDCLQLFQGPRTPATMWCNLETHNGTSKI